jgi:hypothetical protein
LNIFKTELEGCISYNCTKLRTEKESKNLITDEFFVPTVEFNIKLPNSIFRESLCTKALKYGG